MTSDRARKCIARVVAQGIAQAKADLIASVVIATAGVGQSAYTLSQGNYANGAIGVGFSLTSLFALAQGANGTASAGGNTEQGDGGIILISGEPAEGQNISPAPAPTTHLQSEIGYGVIIDSRGQIVGVGGPITGSGETLTFDTPVGSVSIPPDTRGVLALSPGGGGFEITLNNPLRVDFPGPLNGSVSSVQFDAAGYVAGNNFRFAGIPASRLGTHFRNTYVGQLPGLPRSVNQFFVAINQTRSGL